MNKSVIFGARIRAKANQIVSLEAAISDLEAKRSGLLAQLERAETSKEVDNDELALAGVQSELDEKLAEKAALEQEINELEQEIQKLNDKAPKPDENRGGKKTMNKETREALNTYIRSQGRSVTGLKTVDGGALVPTEILKAQETPEKTVDLSTLVNVVKVNTGSGKYPVIKKSGQKMNSVAELAKNPELGKPSVTPIDYSIETYRGYIPVSQELVDDADYDIMGLVADEIISQERATKNAEIAAILKTATAKTATGFDGLKDILNKEISSIYNKTLVVTDSLYAALDKVKDKNGRYMLQPDPTSPTGHRFSGYVILPMDDEIIGASKGDLKAFIGDIKAFATLFDRKQATVKWQDNDIYGQLMGIATRFDVKKTDSAAGVYVTYTDAVG